MSGHGEKLSRKQEQAISALLMQPSIIEAANSIGVNEATLSRWLQQPDFAERYREAKRQAVQQAIARLQQVSGGAVETLREIMANSEAKDSARVSAAKIILEMAVKGVELEDLASRVEALELTLAGKEGVANGQ